MEMAGTESRPTGFGLFHLKEKMVSAPESFCRSGGKGSPPMNLDKLIE